MLFATPELDDVDLRVIAEVDGYRRDMRYALREPKRWTGQLRRNLLAKAIQGSNSIEGYDVSDDDAVAAVDEDEPMTASEETWAEIRGYRNAMSYVLQLADDPHFKLDQSLVRSLHYMMLSHDIHKSPGRYRQKTVYVVDESKGEVVYEGPDWELIHNLMEELVGQVFDQDETPSFVRAAMAHLNLVMIHPFRDGNGRMARCLQTLILARDRIVAPEFSSVEEFLGRNTPDYYAVLAAVGAGSWNPENDARSWVKFILHAHHIQAQTVLVRLHEAGKLWSELEGLVERLGLSDRTVPALYDAAIGLRLRRSAYVKHAEVEDRTATRDLQALVDADLLLPQGERRGRTYSAAPVLRDLRSEARRHRPRIVAPYGDINDLIRRPQQAMQPRLPFTD